MYDVKPNVFTDFHHAGLLESLIMLFEGRLGGKLYRPIGEEWYKEGFWKVYDHPATVKQYLSLDQGFRPQDGSAPLNQIEKEEADVYFCHDISSHQVNKAITLETFKRLPIDIVIASIPQHIELFKRLIREYKPNAKLIFQIGNQWPAENVDVKNIMASAAIGCRDSANFVSYHQEFDLGVFHPKWGTPPDNRIFSFINCFSTDGLFKEDWELFLEVEKLMPDWEFCSFGGQGRDGTLPGTKAVAEYMNAAKFIWHTKKGGDGYGHILFNSAAVGKPTICKVGYYRGKLGEKLLEDGKTCIAIDGLSPTEIVNKILYYSEEKPFLYNNLRLDVYDNFKKTVNFDEDEIHIRQFLRNLI